VESPLAVAEKSYSLPSIMIGKDWKISSWLGEVQLLVLLGPAGVMVVHLQSGWGVGGVSESLVDSDSVTVFSAAARGRAVVTIFVGEGPHSSVVVVEHSSLVPVQSCNKEMTLAAHQRFLLRPIEQSLVLHLDEQRQETLVL